MPQEGKKRFREDAISALLSSPTLEKAAAMAGISKRTLLRWMKEPEFRHAYLEAKADVLRTATGILTRNSGKAAEVLAAIFSSKPKPNQASRVAAAVHNIRLALDAFELESLEERVRKLEEQSSREA